MKTKTEKKIQNREIQNFVEVEATRTEKSMKMQEKNWKARKEHIYKWLDLGLRTEKDIRESEVNWDYIEVSWRRSVDALEEPWILEESRK